MDNKINIESYQNFELQYSLNSGIFYLLEGFIFVHYSQEFQKFYNLLSHSDNIIDEEIKNISYFYFLSDLDFEIVFYSKIQGIGIQSIQYETEGKLFDSGIQDEIYFLKLDLIHSFVIAGNLQKISIYYYGNIFMDGLQLIVSKNLNLNLNYIILYEPKFRKVILSYELHNQQNEILVCNFFQTNFYIQSFWSEKLILTPFLKYIDTDNKINFYFV